jgi:hypothetical protein
MYDIERNGCIFGQRKPKAEQLSLAVLYAVRGLDTMQPICLRDGILLLRSWAG